LEGLAEMSEREVHILCCLLKPLPAPPKLAENIYHHSVAFPNRRLAEDPAKVAEEAGNG
jgi:hypothetical protein